MSGAIRKLPDMTATLIGYARCSTDAQDLTAQRETLLACSPAAADLGPAKCLILIDRATFGSYRSLDQSAACQDL